MSKRVVAGCFALAFVSILYATPAVAGPRDFVISMSGFLGTTKQAEPVLAKLFRHLEGELGWPASSIGGAYYPEPSAGLAHLKQDQPGFAVVTHQMYAEHRAAMKMQVIGAMELSDGALARFHVVTKKQGGASNLAGLRGKSVASPHLREVLFATKILFGGHLAVGQDVTPIHVAAPLRALRKVHRDQAAAAVVDEPVAKQLASLPFGSDLQIIHSTDQLPPLPVVALGASAASDRQGMAKALRQMCGGGEGAELCKSLRLRTVRQATHSDFAALERLLKSR